jgi:hypothetical protein
MAIIIGAATTVRFNNSDYCVISANWGYNPNVQRLYCIGEWTPTDARTYYKPTETLSLTLYAPGPTHSVTPTQSCADANSIQASLDPRACGASFPALSGNWLVQSYNYSKDDGSMPGQESWSLTRWKGLNSTPPSNFVAPDYVMRGITEGSASEPTSDTGVVFQGTTITSYTGNVSAGGFGKADTMRNGVVISVGGGTSTVGRTGQGSASMPYTPLYL